MQRSHGPGIFNLRPLHRTILSWNRRYEKLFHIVKPYKRPKGTDAVNGSMMTEQGKSAVRAVVFGHLAGIVLAPTVKALADHGVLQLFGGAGNWLSLKEIGAQVPCNAGYLRVALRLLASLGWAEQRAQSEGGRNVSFALTREGAVAAEVAPRMYAEVVPFIKKALVLEDCLFRRTDDSVLEALRTLAFRSMEGWAGDKQSDPIAAEVCRKVRRHLDGILLGPAMVALSRGGVFAELKRGPVHESAFHANPAALACVLNLLITQGWLSRDEQDCVSLTPAGWYAAQIATSYGVTVSYLPTFAIVETLLFGDPNVPRVDKSGVELLVNRDMNVWGSGGAHQTYFKTVDEIIIEIFNRPLHLQPKGICDMGCGDASFLQHLHEVVKNHTLRGQVLDRHPLFLVGADINRVARRIAQQRLHKAGIPSYRVLPGDINRPAQLAADFESIGLDVHDLLHVRSFLDHNRTYSPTRGHALGNRKAQSTGAFSHRGKEIFPDELEENLVQHLRRWAPYVGRFGLIVLELHTLPPRLTAANLEKTLSIAYDGTHGFSDQYLVELPVFLECAREAGLRPDPGFQARFPDSELATVSINFFVPLPPPHLSAQTSEASKLAEPTLVTGSAL
jgi:hypothetical protein